MVEMYLSLIMEVLWSFLNTNTSPHTPASSSAEVKGTGPSVALRKAISSALLGENKLMRRLCVTAPVQIVKSSIRPVHRGPPRTRDTLYEVMPNVKTTHHFSS